MVSDQRKRTQRRGCPVWVCNLSRVKAASTRRAQRGSPWEGWWHELSEPRQGGGIKQEQHPGMCPAERRASEQGGAVGPTRKMG